MLFQWPYLVMLSSAVLVYYVLPKRFHVAFLQLISVATIALIRLSSLVLLVVLTWMTFTLSKTRKKAAKHLGILVHLIFLICFKSDLSWVSQNSSIDSLTFIGASYWSLQNISVLLSSKVIPDWKKLFLANVFFPRFVAGPILLNKDIISLRPSGKNWPINIASGSQRILFGLGKKLILADRLSILTNNLLEQPQPNGPGISIAVGSVLFTLQMYLDFSAYSDIAIGSAKLFGIDLKENFKLPFRSKTVSEYWRRTHLSLIEWLTTHLYYPIIYALRTHNTTAVTTAIFVTFTLSGLWHGKHMGYLIWGLMNAIYLLTEYLGRKHVGFVQRSVLGLPVTLILISASNLFFFAKSWSNAQTYLNVLVNNKFFPSDWMTEFVAILGNGGHFLQQYNLLETAGLILLFFTFENKLEKLSRREVFSYRYLTIMMLSILFFGYFNSGDEFIYVQF